MMTKLPTGDWVDVTTIHKVYGCSRNAPPIIYGICVECVGANCSNLTYEFGEDSKLRDEWLESIGQSVATVMTELRTHKEAHARNLAIARAMGAYGPGQ